MKSPFRSRLNLVLLLALTALTDRISAVSLLLDFGPTSVSGTDVTLSMGHFAGAVPGTEISWNKIVNADATSGLLFADGTAASSVSVIVGRTDAGVNNTINFNNKNLTSSALGGQETWGIYTNTSPLKDGIFAPGTSAMDTNAVGIRVDGLAAGTYTLYISGRNTSTALTSTQRIFAAAGASSANFAFSTNTTPYIDEANSASPIGSGNPTQADAITSTFAYGDNCVHLVVTLGTGESLYLAATGIAANQGFRGFLNAMEIVSGAPVLTNFPATVGVQPGNVTTYEGSSVVVAGAKFGGVPPLYYQWYYNNTAITGATNTTLPLAGVIPEMAGQYSVKVHNQINTATSSNAVLTVIPLYNTGQMTNLWNLVPGSTTDNRFYLSTTDGGERGLAFNPATSNLLLVCHVPTNNIVVLNPTNGAEKYFMNLTYVPATAAGVNMIGVADDGTVYTCGATANASSSSAPFYIIQWANDAPETIANGYAFAADPGANDAAVGAAGLRWGDSFAVRGSGPDTQLLCGPGSGTNVCLFTTADGFSFSPNIITVSNVPSGFAQFGLTFGPDTNTFWAKTSGRPLYLIQFDLNTKTGFVLQSYTNVPPSSFKLVSTGSTNKWLAGIMRVGSGLPDNVRLYNISDLTNGPVLADQELYSTSVLHGLLGNVGLGATAFGGNYLFALDENNGLKAFYIDPNYVPSLAPFRITSLQPVTGPAVVITWQSVATHTYQVQAKNSLLDPTWTDVGAPITASGSTLSATNSLTTTPHFYRVKGN